MSYSVGIAPPFGGYSSSGYCLPEGGPSEQIVQRSSDSYAQQAFCIQPTYPTCSCASKMEVETSDLETSSDQSFPTTSATSYRPVPTHQTYEKSYSSFETMPFSASKQSLGSPAFRPTPIFKVCFHSVPTDTFVIHHASRIVAQIAALSLRFAVKHPLSSVSLPPTFDVLQHCCAICKRTTLPTLALNVARQEQEARLHSPQPAVPDPNDSVEAIKLGTFEADMQTTLLKMFGLLQNSFRIRTTEIIQSVILFDRICKAHWMCFTYSSLFRNSLKTMFLGCVLVVHKANADLTIRNTCWADAFGLPLYTLDQFELTVLDLLAWSVHIKLPEYRAFRSLILGLSQAPQQSSYSSTPGLLPLSQSTSSPFSQSLGSKALHQGGRDKDRDMSRDGEEEPEEMAECSSLSSFPSLSTPLISAPPSFPSVPVYEAKYPERRRRDR